MPAILRTSLSRNQIAAVVTIAGLATVMAWDFSGLDMVLARLVADERGFRLRDLPFLTSFMHEGARLVAAAVLLALCAGIVRPFGALSELTPARRTWFLIAVLIALALINQLKHLSASSCPWSLREFGGTVPHVPHWLLGRVDGGPGHCFPAAHASAGFAFLAGWFAWQPGSRSSRNVLLAALAAGFALGIAQQLRGAHFMSHTLWSAWICWVSGWLLSKLLPRS